MLQTPPLPPAFESTEFAARAEEEAGSLPDRAKWQELEWCLRGKSLLEIGPGTGHFLAAAREAGYSVFGIEPDPFLRAYIRRHWNIETTADALDALPPATVDSVVSFNCIEHIVDPMAHVAAVFRVLRPGGRFLVSTCNADCLVTKIVGRYWSMFKEPTHVSVPSPDSLRIVGRRAGLMTIKLWSAEFPLETPAGFAVAWRDWRRDRRSRKTNAPVHPPAGTAGTTGQPLAETMGACDAEPSASPRAGFARRLIKARQFSWVAACMSHFMLAGSIKALYEKRGDG